ncbi:YdcF family protein [Patescibacteria group bacterium]|nr:YdcF family protein [Patescibacteria group bacterium]
MKFWKWFERRFAVTDDVLPPTPADVIICIGIDVFKDGYSASPSSREVAYKGRELFSQGYGRNILVSGGYHFKGLSEARAIAVILEKGVPTGNVFLDEIADRTWFNASESLKHMQAHDWQTAVVVAHPWHARRVKATFKKRWKNSDYSFAVVKARSAYGNGSQKRLDNFWLFLFWDTLAFVFSKFKGYV